MRRGKGWECSRAGVGGRKEREGEGGRKGGERRRERERGGEAGEVNKRERCDRSHEMVHPHRKGCLIGSNGRSPW